MLSLETLNKQLNNLLTPVQKDALDKWIKTQKETNKDIENNKLLELACIYRYTEYLLQISYNQQLMLAQVNGIVPKDLRDNINEFFDTSHNAAQTIQNTPALRSAFAKTESILVIPTSINERVNLIMAAMQQPITKAALATAHTVATFGPQVTKAMANAITASTAITAKQLPPALAPLAPFVAPKPTPAITLPTDLQLDLGKKQIQKEDVQTILDYTAHLASLSVLTQALQLKPQFEGTRTKEKDAIAEQILQHSMSHFNQTYMPENPQFLSFEQTFSSFAQAIIQDTQFRANTILLAQTIPQQVATFSSKMNQDMQRQSGVTIEPATDEDTQRLNTVRPSLVTEPGRGR